MIVDQGRAGEASRPNPWQRRLLKAEAAGSRVTSRILYPQMLKRSWIGATRSRIGATRSQSGATRSRNGAMKNRSGAKKSLTEIESVVMTRWTERENGTGIGIVTVGMIKWTGKRTKNGAIIAERSWLPTPRARRVSGAAGPGLREGK